MSESFSFIKIEDQFIVDNALTPNPKTGKKADAIAYHAPGGKLYVVESKKIEESKYDVVLRVVDLPHSKSISEEAFKTSKAYKVICTGNTTKTDRTFKWPVTSLQFSPTYAFFAIWSHKSIYVGNCPADEDLTSAAIDGKFPKDGVNSNVVEVQELADGLCETSQNLEIIKCDWHPASHSHLAVLLSADMFKVFNVLQDTYFPESEIQLNPPHKMRMAPSADPGKMSRYCSFVFGAAVPIFGWHKFAIFFLTTKGEVFLICPYLLHAFNLEQSHFLQMQAESREKLNQPILKKFVEFLDNNSSVEANIRYFKLPLHLVNQDWKPSFRGPIHMVGTSAAQDLLYTDCEIMEYYPMILALTNNQPQVEIHISFDNITPEWGRKYAEVKGFSFLKYEVIELDQCEESQDQNRSLRKYEPNIVFRDDLIFQVAYGFNLVQIQLDWAEQMSKNLQQQNYDFENLPESTVVQLVNVIGSEMTTKSSPGQGNTVSDKAGQVKTYEGIEVVGRSEITMKIIDGAQVFIVLGITAALGESVKDMVKTNLNESFSIPETASPLVKRLIEEKIPTLKNPLIIREPNLPKSILGKSKLGADEDQMENAVLFTTLIDDYQREGIGYVHAKIKQISERLQICEDLDRHQKTMGQELVRQVSELERKVIHDLTLKVGQVVQRDEELKTLIQRLQKKVSRIPKRLNQNETELLAKLNQMVFDVDTHLERAHRVRKDIDSLLKSSRQIDRFGPGIEIDTDDISVRLSSLNDKLIDMQQDVDSLRSWDAAEAFKQTGF